MAARLGNVIYWLAVALAVLCAVTAFSGAYRGDPAVPFLIGVALIAYAVGWIARYVLSGVSSP